jgi:hypothetical protein
MTTTTTRIVVVVDPAGVRQQMRLGEAVDLIKARYAREKHLRLRRVWNKKRWAEMRA